MKQSKPVKYESEFYINLIKNYYLLECNMNVSKLKITNIAKYAKSIGYTNVEEYDIRRNKEAREYIRKLKETPVKSNNDIRNITYKTLNVKDFLNKHNSPAKLKIALQGLDTQSKIQYEGAINILKENQNLHKKYNELQLQIVILQNTLKDELMKLSETLQCNHKLHVENQYLKTVVGKYTHIDNYSELEQTLSNLKDETMNLEILTNTDKFIEHLSFAINNNQENMDLDSTNDLEIFLNELEEQL